MSGPTAPGVLAALNPPIYLVSILPGIGVWLLARPAGQELLALVLATLAVVLIQHAVNLLNDVSDWRLGADEHKFGSWVRYHAGGIRAAAVHGWLSSAVGALLGLGVLVYAGRLWILAIAAPMVLLGYLYNSGERPLSYTRLGEWVTGLCYGPGVVGCLWLLLGRPVTAPAVLAMLAFAALAVALLLSHQPPQIGDDRAAGKHSFAVRYGATTTYRVSRLLFGVFLVSWGLALLLSGWSWIGMALFAVATIWAVAALAGNDAGPKRVLLSATGMIAAVAVGEALPL